MDYINNYKTCKIKEPDMVMGRANLILFYVPRYVVISKATGVPWQIIGCIHSLETGCLVTRHLHNGDRLTARTINVPSGRPVGGKPPYSFEESAIDALNGRSLPKIPSLSSWLAFLEAYNGHGYRNRGLISPYLWSFTDVYEKGYFSADGKFDPELVSKNIGAVALLKTLNVDESTFAIS